MTHRRITATTPDGRTVSRRTAAAYVAAVVYVDGTATWHTTHARAAKKARRAGGTVAVVSDAPTGACVVCSGTRKVTYGPSAVDGTFSTVDCHRCVKAAS